ncbi:MAG: hypothetical protein LBK57_03640 [Clostridiales Family XIII bacterium]|jgi:hypothetical protein|nr:hypothetical protein [Clostridiales Family XIII bacterium]
MLFITTRGEIVRSEIIGHQIAGALLEPGDDPDEALKVMKSVPFCGRLTAPNTYKDMLPGADALRKYVRNAHRGGR